MKYSALITCQTVNGDAQVEAVAVYGSWAAHRSLSIHHPRPREWTITHVPTGRCIPRSHTDLLRKDQAIEVARRLDAELGAKSARGPTTPVRVVAIIHDVCTGKSAKSLTELVSK